ncbi:MAG: hypothetical protein RR476_02735 [Cetobacterium sp.]
MKKLILAACLLVGSVVSYAGIVKDNGKDYLTKIETQDKNDHIRFKASFPKVSIRVRKKDIIKAMLSPSGRETKTIGELERNGIVKSDRMFVVFLRRKNDGLWLEVGNISMFVTEKELDKVKR